MANDNNDSLNLNEIDFNKKGIHPGFVLKE